MLFRFSPLFLILLTSFATIAGPTHDAARKGNWAEVARLIREEGHVLDNELSMIATQRGDFGEFEEHCKNFAGYPAAPAVMREMQGREMERVHMASAEINLESASVSAELALLDLQRLETFLSHLQKLHLHAERAQLIIKEWPAVLELSQNLRAHLQSAYTEAGRFAELAALNFDAIGNPREVHGATLTKEVVQKGGCQPTCVNEALTKSWWAGKTCDVWGKVFDNNPVDGLCCTFPMCVGFIALNFAQGLAILPTLPGFWYWKKGQTKLKGTTDDNTELEFKLFIETMKTIYNKFIKG